MNCKRCGKKSTEELCDRCFKNVVERKIRKHIRLSGLFKQGSKVHISDSLVRMFFAKKHGLVFTNTKGSIHVMPKSMDAVLSCFMDYLLSGKKPVSNHKDFYVFEPLTNAELKRYGQIVNVRVKSSPESEILNCMEEDYPGTKHSMYNAIKGLT